MARTEASSFRYGPPRAPPVRTTSSSMDRQASGPFPSQETDGLQTLYDFVIALPHPRYWPAMLTSFFIIEPLTALFTTFIALVTSPRTHRAVLRLSILASLFWAALILAILAYVGFYRAWVPHAGRIEEVHLQYGRAGQVPAGLVDLRGLRGQEEDWFAEEQEYDVSVELLVPISAANLDLGNFMVSIDLLSADNITLFSSSKPTILRPSTPPLRFLNQIASQMTPRPSLAGGYASVLPLPFTSPSLELMTINLFDRLIIHPSPGRIPFANPEGSPLQSAGGRRKIAKALIRIGREDSEKYWIYGGGHGVGGVVTGGINPDGSLSNNGMVLATQNAGGTFRSRGELQTVGVGLRFDARLTGLRYLLYTRPVLSFFFFTALFLTFELLSALTLWTLAAVYTSTLPGLGVDLTADNQFVPYAQAGRGRSSDEDDEGDSTTIEGRRRRRAAAGGDVTPSTLTAGDDTDDDESFASSSDTETESTIPSRDAQARARASLRARDEQERREAQAALEEEALRSGRLMTGLRQENTLSPSDTAGEGARIGGSEPPELLSPAYRRVLGRLDEETEEETDAGSDTSSSRPTGQSTTSSERAPVRRGGPAGVRDSSSAEASEELSQPSSSRSSRDEEDLTPPPGESASQRGGTESEEDEGDETVLVGAAQRAGGEEQGEETREGFRRRKAFTGEGGEREQSEEYDAGSRSLLGGSATDPSGSGSIRSFGATTQASRRTDDTATTR